MTNLPRADLLKTDFLRAESGDTAPGQGPLSVALSYPNTYSVGMSSLGYLCVRAYARDLGFTRVERAFTLSCGGKTLETGRSPSEFDVAAFSVAYEMDYANLLASLDSTGLALFASRRDVHSPLVLVGGLAVALNRHPIYPFADVLVHEGGRAAVERVLSACAERDGFRRDPAARRALYGDLAAIDGVEVTAGACRALGLDPMPGHVALSPEVETRIEENLSETGLCIPLPPRRDRLGDCLDATDVEISRIATPYAELGRRVLVEIARGCPHACGFCWIGHRRREMTPHPARRVVEACDAACDATGCDSVGLIASAVGAHPEIDEICRRLVESGKRVSFSSLRADEITPVMLDALVRSGQKSVTLAPEAGDEDLRRRLGKSIADATFMETIERCLRAGLQDVKLYFMTGLPGETEPQADAIVSFARRVNDLMRPFGRDRGRLGNLSVNLGIYIPKPLTPLASRETPAFATVRSRARRVARALGVLPNTQASSPSPDLCLIQAHLSMGGLESAALLLELHRAGPRWRETARGLARRDARGHPS